MSAPDTFKRMRRDEIAPALRSIGLRGSGTTYSIPSDSHWALIAFQGSTGNTAERMKFTVNCKVVRRDTWDAELAEHPYIGPKPKANVIAGTFEWVKRIGKLMPSQEDTWWWIASAGESDRVADEVIEAITRYALPAMREQIAVTA